MGEVDLGNPIGEPPQHAARIAVTKLGIGSIQLHLGGRKAGPCSLYGPSDIRNDNHHQPTLQKGQEAGAWTSRSISSSRKQRLSEAPAISMDVV